MLQHCVPTHSTASLFFVGAAQSIPECKVYNMIHMFELIKVRKQVEIICSIRAVTFTESDVTHRAYIVHCSCTGQEGAASAERI